MIAKRVCYYFHIKATVTKKNGKTYSNHQIKQMGFSYDDAITSAYFELKSKKTKLLKIHEVSVAGIAFAYDHELNFFNANLQDYPVAIPDDLNHALKRYLGIF